jgi:hypothetical protein
VGEQLFYAIIAVEGSGLWGWFFAPPRVACARPLDRLSADGQARYGHPVLLVETFVDAEQFCGTVYRANGWQELGVTDGFGRVRRDFYTQHHQPKRLCARELGRHARRRLAAGKLKPSLAPINPNPTEPEPKGE